MTTETKNRVANPLLLDVPVQLPEERRIFLPESDRVNRVSSSYNTTTNNVNHDYSQRHYNINIHLEIGSNNSGGKSSGGMGLLGTLIGIGAILFLLTQGTPFLGEFDRLGDIFKLRW